MKVVIVVITFNLDSRIFLLQMEAIKKFCKDDYVIEIFDNSTDNDLAEAIRYHSEIQGINYRKCNADDPDYSSSHAWALNLSYHLLKNEDYRYFLYFDHDIIPSNFFSVRDILGEDYVFAGLGQGKNGKTYYWPGLVMFDNEKVDKELIDFSVEMEYYFLDTGGKLYKSIEKVGKEKCLFFKEEYHENKYHKQGKYNFYSVINKVFIHFLNSSNWNPIDDNEGRLNALLNIAQEKIDANVEG